MFLQPVSLGAMSCGATLRAGLVVALTLAITLGASSAAFAKGPKGKGHHGGHGGWHTHGPSVVVVQASGTLRVHNPTSHPFRVKVDGQSMGVVQPGGQLVVAQASPGQHVVESRLVGARGMEQRVSAVVNPGGLAVVQLQVPLATLRVRNHQPVTVTLRVDGQLHATLQPGDGITLDGLVAGAHHVEMVGPWGMIAGRTVHLMPGEREKWAPPAALGAVTVTNAAHAAVTVQLEGGQSMVVAPGGTAHFNGIPAGTRDVYVTGKHGKTVQTKLGVRPHATTAWTFIPPKPAYKPHGGPGAQVAWMY